MTENPTKNLVHGGRKLVGDAQPKRTSIKS